MQGVNLSDLICYLKKFKIFRSKKLTVFESNNPPVLSVHHKHFFFNSIKP